MPNKKIIVVLGMDRSGTSLCMNILNMLGVGISDNLLPPNKANTNGYFESRFVMDLNNSVFKVLGTDWNIPGLVKPLPVAWWRLPELLPIRKKLVEFVGSEIESKRVWGIKDPRIARLLPLWKEVFYELELTPYYVLAVRNPLAVAQSLQKRDGLAFDLSEILWIERNINALSYVEKMNMIVHYEDWFVEPVRVAKQLAEVLFLPWVGDDIDLEAMLRRVINPEDRHDNERERQKYSFSLTERLYYILRTGTPRDISDMVNFGRQAFAINQDINSYLLQKPRENIAKLESSITTLTATIAERERQIEQLRQENSQRLAQITEMESNVSNLTNQTMERDQKIAHLTQENTKKEARIAELQATVANLNGQVAERDKGITEHSGQSKASA